MALVPISRDLHAKTKVRPLTSLSFAAGVTAIPIYGGEMVTMSYEVPVAFVRNADGYSAIALTGLRSGQNLLIDPQGRWMGQHIPAVWRRGPFRLAQVQGQDDGNMVMCLDDSSDLVNETEGTPLFDEQGAPTTIIGTASTLLSQMQRDIHSTRIVCAVLEKIGLIVPWNLDIPQPDGTSRRVSDLFQVDEAKIATLSADDLVALRDCGALPLIYAHLLSLSKIHLLARLARLIEDRAQQQSAVQQGNVNLDRAFGIVEDDPFLF